jgi:integrase/recombinase XerD
MLAAEGVPAKLRDQLAERGLSPRTIREYVRVIADAERWCRARGETLKTAGPSLIADYAASKPRSYSTQNIMRAALAAFWETTGRRRPPTWAIRVPSKPRGRCLAVTEAEALALEQAAVARGDRKGLVVLCGLYLALRREEIAALRWDSFSDGWLRVVGKGDRTADLPVHPVLEAALASADHSSPWVFPGRFAGQPIHPATAWSWTREVALAAGIGLVRTHQLRHTALATANDATGDLRGVQVFARHASPETTAIYTRVGPRRLRKVMLSIDYAAVAAEAAG